MWRSIEQNIKAEVGQPNRLSWIYHPVIKASPGIHHITTGSPDTPVPGNCPVTRTMKGSCLALTLKPSGEKFQQVPLPGWQRPSPWEHSERMCFEVKPTLSVLSYFLKLLIQNDHKAINQNYFLGNEQCETLGKYSYPQDYPSSNSSISS